MPEDIDPEDIKARLFALDGLHDLTTLWIEVDGYSVQCSQVDPRPDDVAFLPLGETEGCLAKYERVTDVRAFRGTTPVFAHTPKAKEPAHAKQYEESLFERRERERLEAIKSAAASGVDHTLDDLDVLQRIEELKALRRIKAAAKRAFDIYAHNIDTNVPTLPVLDRVASMLVFNETMIDLGRALAGADE